MKSDLQGKRILIFQQRGWAIAIGIPLARKLELIGCRLAALTIKRSTYQAILSSGVKYDLVFDADSVKESPADYIYGESLTLDDVCAGLGIESIWELAQASRYHVKSYTDKYYFGFKQNIPDNDIRNYIVSIYKYTVEIFDEFRPDFIVTPNFAGLQHAIFNLYARQQGVPMIGFVDSKIPEYTIFTTGYLADRGRFFDRVKALNADFNHSISHKIRDEIQVIRRRILENNTSYLSVDLMRKRSLKETFFEEIMPFVHAALYYFRKRKNRLKNQKATLDDKAPYYIFRDYFVAKWWAWHADTHCVTQLDEFDEYVYFPLQVQPEASIDIVASRFNNQIETARQVAMSLPGQFRLLVKDHPTMRNKRPVSYLEKLSRIPNVTLLSSKFSTEEVLDRVRLVIASSGTTIFQASMLHIPVIQLGELGTTRLLPNVYYHTDLSTLSKRICEVMEKPVDIEKTDLQLGNYLQAAQEVGFDLEYYSIAEQRRQFTSIEVELICDRIIKELKCF